MPYLIQILLRGGHKFVLGFENEKAAKDNFKDISFCIGRLPENVERFENHDGQTLCVRRSDIVAIKMFQPEAMSTE